MHIISERKGIDSSWQSFHTNGRHTYDGLRRCTNDTLGITDIKTNERSIVSVPDLFMLDVVNLKSIDNTGVYFFPEYKCFNSFSHKLGSGRLCMPCDVGHGTTFEDGTLYFTDGFLRDCNACVFKDWDMEVDGIHYISKFRFHNSVQHCSLLIGIDAETGCLVSLESLDGCVVPQGYYKFGDRHSLGDILKASLARDLLVARRSNLFKMLHTDEDDNIPEFDID